MDLSLVTARVCNKDPARALGAPEPLSANISTHDANLGPAQRSTNAAGYFPGSHWAVIAEDTFRERHFSPACLFRPSTNSP